MKNSIKALMTPLVFLLGALLVSSVAPAQLLEHMDAETNDWSQWRSKVGGGTENHAIVSDPVCAGNYAFKWTQSDGRTESAAEYQPVDTDLWYGFSMYLAPDFTTDVDETVCVRGASVAQIHGYTKECPDSEHAAAMLRINDGQFKWWLKGMGDIGGCYERLAPAETGRWVRFVVNLKLTTGGDGYFKCWIDGELVLEKYGSSWSNCREGAYFKMGTYAWAQAGDWMLGDEIRIGRSRSDVDPANVCGNAPSVPVSGVAVTTCPTVPVGIGASLSLRATVSPSEASDKSVSWTSSDAAVASVNDQGVVTTLSEGQATITATTRDGGFTDQCSLNVSASGCVEQNVALGGSIHSRSGEQDGNPASNLIDGVADDDANRWSSYGYPQWVIVDLGSDQRVSSTRLYGYEDRDYQYQVYASSSLDEVVSKSATALVADGGGSSPEGIHRFGLVVARYVRLEVVGANGYDGDWVSARELEVLGCPVASTSSTVAIRAKESSPTTVAVYPNPSTDQVVIEGPTHYQIEVYHLRGGLIEQTGERSGRSQLDVADLPPGVYMLRVTDTDTQQTYQQRLVIE